MRAPVLRRIAIPLAALPSLAAACGPPEPPGRALALEAGARVGGAPAAALWSELRDGFDPSALAALGDRGLALREEPILWSDARRAFVLAPGERWRSRAFEVPEGAALRTAVRLARAAEGSAGSAALSALGSGDRRELARATVRAADGWTELRAELADLAGERIELELAFDSTAGDAALHLAAPRVGTGADDRASVLLVTIDTLRRDHLAPWGASEERTPAAAALARAGVVVERAWSSSPWTLPAYASLVTGEEPSTHGAGRDWSVEWEGGTVPHRVLGEGARSLVEGLAATGYEVAGWHNNPFLRRGSGIERGFHRWVHYGTRGRTAVDELEAWLETRAPGPFLALVHFAGPHPPYLVPERYDAPVDHPAPIEVPSLGRAGLDLVREGVPPADREAFRALYAALVSYVDARVGELLDAVAARRDAPPVLVVLHADHGEELWDRGGWYHGHTQHEELVRVPLIFSLPGVLPEGERVVGDVRGIDVLPTVLDLLGHWPPPAGRPAGRSFVPLLLGGTGEPRPALSEAPLFGSPDDFAVTRPPWRLVRSGGADRLFQIEEDPRERVDRAAEEPEVAAELARLGEHLRERARARATRAAAARPLDAETARQLERLGYAGPSGPRDGDRDR